MKTRVPSDLLPRHVRRRLRKARAVALGVALASGAMARPAVAQQVRPGPEARATFAFDLPEGTVASVLAGFEATTGLRVTLADPEFGMVMSPGVKGTMTARDALTALLMGTSLSASVDADGIRVGLASITQSVDVVGRGPTVSSPRYTVPLRDIAQTVTLVPRAVIEQQGAMTLSDTLRNVPGITLQAGEGGGASNTAGDMFNMRGFSANNSLFVDNVRDSGLISRDVFNVEQVEVFMGPTGSDVGRGTAAGYVNMQTKRAHAGTSANVLVSGGNANQARMTADVNWGAAENAGGSWISRSAFRVNALWQDRGQPGRDVVKNESTAIAPSMSLGLGTSTRVFATTQVVRQDNVPDYGIPSAGWADAALAPTVVRTERPVAQTNFYGSRDFDYDRAAQTSVMGRIERDVNRRVTITNQTRYNQTHREAVVSAITNVAAYSPATGLVTIARQGNERENSIVSNQTTVVQRFTTGRLRHGFSSGMELLRETQFAPSLTGLGTRAPVDIYAPNPAEPVTGFAPVRTLAETKGTTTSAALYANDSVEVGQRWLVAGGFRVERYSTDYRAVNATGVVTADLTGRGTLASGRGSVLYRISNEANLYVSYGTTVTPPGEANFQLSAAANNVNNPNVDPQRSANLEFGTKVDLADGRLALNGSVFRTRNKNIIFTVDAAAVPPIFNQNDDQLVKGVSAGALGRITDRWQVMANAAYLDATLQSQGANNGARLVLTPAFSGSLWTTVRVIGGLSVGGGVRHVGRAYVNAANTIVIPAYSLVDGLAEYAVNSHLSLRLNMYNLTDEVYIRNVNNNGGRYNPGLTRSFLLTSSLGF